MNGRVALLIRELAQVGRPGWRSRKRALLRLWSETPRKNRLRRFREAYREMVEFQS